MPFDHIVAQPIAVETLTRALRAKLVHHAYRFEGPEGVGKELTAVALAQALLCTTGDVLGCGACDACRRANERVDADPPTSKHPDLIMVKRGFYAPATIGGKKETSEISVEQIRRIVLPSVPFAPHEGRARVFIVRDADTLSVQAANALLKTLEEPRPSTHFLLLVSGRRPLLDTIASRSLPIRFCPLPDAVVAKILREHDVPDACIEAAVQAGGGSASLALKAADAESHAKERQFVGDVFRAVSAPSDAAAVALAEGLRADRPELIVYLEALKRELVLRVRQAAGSEPRAAERDARRYMLVADAIDSLARNGSATLTMLSLIASLRVAFQCRPGQKPAVVMARR